MNGIRKFGSQQHIGHTAIAALLILLLTWVTGSAALAADPPQPTYGSATVDGNYGEWNLSSDFFANMYRAGKPDKQIESYLYLRYDCATSTGYALVLAKTGVDVLMQPSDAFVKLGNSTKLVDGNSPNFAWVQPNAQTGRAQGWEASFALAPGTYSNLNVHVQVYDDGSQTSAVAERAIPLTIDCSSVTPTPSETPIPSETPSETPEETPTPSETPSETPDETPTPSETPSETPEETPTPSETPAETPEETPTPSLPGPSFGSCYNPTTQSFRLTVVNKADVPAYIGYDIYGQANSFVSLGLFAAGETRSIHVTQEGTLRKYISADGQSWAKKGGTHVLSVAGHTANNLLCKGGIEAGKFRDDNANGIQDTEEASLGNWSMMVFAGTVDEDEQPIATGATDPVSGYVTFDKLLPGAYTVCEGSVEGWLPTIALCQPVTVTSEQTASVTFGNVQGGRIIVDKVTDPADAPDKFGFGLTQGEVSVASFELSHADTPFDSGLLMPGAYTIEESATNGWELSDVTCVDMRTGQQASDIPNPVVIALQAGQTVSCTFTNTKLPPTPEFGSLSVIKIVDWGNVTPDETQSFQICIAGPSYPNGNESGACQHIGHTGGSLTWDNVEVGSYVVTESNPGAGWSVSGSGASVSVTANLTVQHNVVNTAIAPPPVEPDSGSLSVTKVVDWSGITPDMAQTFEICIIGPSFPSGAEEGACQVVGAAGGELVWTKVVPGAYAVVESNPGADWTVTGSNASVDVSAGTRTLHTVTNTLAVVPPPPPVEPQVGGLEVTKIVDWADTTPDTTQTFHICIAGPSFPNGNEAAACHDFGADGGSYTWTDLAPGAYIVTEIGVDSELWTVVGSGASIDVVVNSVASHTLTNKRIDVGGEGGTPTALDPADEPAAFAARLYLPAIQR